MMMMDLNPSCGCIFFFTFFGDWDTVVLPNCGLLVPQTRTKPAGSRISRNKSIFRTNCGTRSPTVFSREGTIYYPWVGFVRFWWWSWIYIIIIYIPLWVPHDTRNEEWWYGSIFFFFIFHCFLCFTLLGKVGFNVHDIHPGTFVCYQGTCFRHGSTCHGHVFVIVQSELTLTSLFDKDRIPSDKFS